LNIKAQGLLNGAKWIEEEYGTSALTEVIRACSPTVRDRYTSAIAINWHPMEEFVEFLGAADRVLGRGDGKIAEYIGASAARANLRGVMVRFAFYVTRPEFLLKRITSLWNQFNDEGAMRLIRLEDTALTFEVMGVTRSSWLFCCAITGWCKEVALATSMVNPIARHPECRARGGARCIWEVRATPKEGPSSGKLPQGKAPSSGKIKPE